MKRSIRPCNTELTRSLSRWFAFLSVLLAISTAVLAQSEPDLEQGMKLYGSYNGGAIDHISLSNGNLFVLANLMDYSQRGGELSYPLVLKYNNKNFRVDADPCDPPAKPGSFECPLRLRVRFDQGDPSMQIGFAGLTGVEKTDIDSGLSFDGGEIFAHSYSAVTPDGSFHQLAVTPAGSLVALDGSGFFSSQPSGVPLTNSQGTANGILGSALDRNGNQLTNTLDTLGRAIPPPPGPGSVVSPLPSTADVGSCPLLNDYPYQPALYAYDWALPSTPNGTDNALHLTLCYTTVQVRTGGATANFFPAARLFPMLQSVVFPDHTFWGFEYDAADPNNSASYAYGDLLKIIFPTGGSISYTWTNSPACSNSTALSFGFSRAVLTRIVEPNDGTQQKWTYSNGVVTDPEQNDTVHLFTALNNTCSLYETETDYYQGRQSDGTVLKRVKTDYQFTINPYDPQLIAGTVPDTVTNVFPKTITTILPSGLQNQVVLTYDTALVYHGPLDGQTSNVCTTDPDGMITCQGQTIPVTNYTGSYGKVTDRKEYDWGKPLPGPLLRETKTTYQWQVDSRYLTANLLDLPSSIQIYDGAGHLCARTDYAYDQATDLQGHSLFISTSGLPQHTTPPSAVRGNFTTVTRWLSATPCQAGATWTQISSHTAYFDTGEVASSIDPLSHTTTHSYDAAYAGAYSTQTCSPQTSTVAHCVSGAYDFNTGLLTSFTDENSQLSSFQYDNRWRMTSAIYPVADSSNVNPETDFLYPDPLTVTRKKKLDSTGAVIQDDAAFDGLGRTKQTILHDPEGNDLVDTTYDALGRVSTVSNPHRAAASSTDGITTSYYDALGRVVQVAPQDGTLLRPGTSPTICQPNNICTDYSNFPTVTVTDHAGKLRRTRTDALGRLVEVDEPGPGANTAGTGATASINISGSLQITNPGMKATGWFSVSGSDNWILDCPPDFECSPKTSPKLWDSGEVTATVNGVAAGVGYGQTSTGADLASSLASQLTPHPVTYTDSGNGTITLTADTPGPNYSLSASALSNDFSDFGAGSFSVATSGATLTGGVYPTYDSGTLTVTVNGFQASAFYSQGLNNTPEVLASALAAALNVSGSPVMAQANGTSITITSKIPGSSGEYSVTGSSSTSFTASSATLGNDTNPGGLFTPYQTFYSYDALGDLLQVNQLGDQSQPARIRTFTYDSLGRLLSAQNPESGKITYTYDDDGDVLTKTAPAPNQPPGSSATVTTTYRYDELNRLTYESFSDGTYRGGFTYDETVSNSVGIPVTNGIGRLTSSWEAWGGQGFSYDALGRPIRVRRAVGHSLDFFYNYNLDGSIKSLQYPSGRVVNYAYDTAGHAISAADSNGTSYANAATYTPAGAVASYVSGASASFGGITNAFSYNQRLQPINMSASTAAQTVFSIGYDFHLGSGNNGNVWNIYNYRDRTRDQSFTYDALNRLTSAQNAGTDCNQVLRDGHTEYWGNSYGYDPWGNLINKSVTKCGAENLLASVLPNNQLAGYGYDAAGNMISDPTDGLSATYDAGNMLKTVGSISYLYDAEGQRFAKWDNGVPVKSYFYGANDEILAEGAGSSNLTAEYIFFHGKRLARVDLPSNAVHYYVSDHLNTASMEVSSAGVIENESDYYPWGGELKFTANDSCNHYKFTGKERDSETGLDYFGARYYSNGLGRFITPDWATKATAVPYAEFADPQSLNLYSYVGNNPLARYDADGHCWPASACAEAVMAKVNQIQQKIENKSTASGHPALAATATFVSGVTRDVINGVASLGTVGKATGACMGGDGCSAGKAALAVGGDLLKAGTIAGGLTALAGKALTATVEVTTTVAHFTNDATVNALTTTGEPLNAGSFVTLPSQIPSGASGAEVEQLLEIGPGKGANSITFDTPNSNLGIPDNGPTTSGGATQFQLRQPTQVDPNKFIKTDKPQ